MASYHSTFGKMANNLLKNGWTHSHSAMTADTTQDYGSFYVNGSLTVWINIKTIRNIQAFIR